MSKKFKKLLCSVLAIAIFSTSGIAVLADEVATATAEAAVTETAADTEATAAPEAAAEPTAEPTATPEPTPVPDPYESDAYYKKALELCTALGIITGYDDGSVKPESTVTRAEMAAIILRMTALSSLSTYRNLFTDVTSSHWAANTIQTASDEGVINGMGDGTFAPDGEVTYEQAVKMVVCGMNYDNEATLKGGYPEGYLAVAAANLSLLDSVKGTRGEAMARGEIIKMVYNALIGPYNELKTHENGQPIYESTQTLAKAKFDLIEEKGLLTGTATTSIAGTTPGKGQITIDGEEFLCDLTDVDKYIGNKITYYYVDNGKADAKVVAILTDLAKTKEVTIDGTDIEKFTGFEEGMGIIETYAGKEYKTTDATVIYNGEFITAEVYNAVAAAETSERFDLIGLDGVNYTEESGKKMTFDEFLKPALGSVRLVDNDGDGKYDVMFVESIETMLITAATEKKITGKINNIAVTLDVDTTDLDKEVTVTLDGTAAKPKNLKKNNVVSLKRNLNNDVFVFSKVDNSITGKITSFEVAEKDVYAVATVNGQDYNVDVNALTDAATGVEGTFMLDEYDKIGYISSDSVITASEKYGWVLSTYLSDSGDEYMVRLYTQDGTTKEYALADKVSYWASNATEATTYSKKEMMDKLDRLSFNVASVSGTIKDEKGNSVAMPPAQVRLVKFSVNAKDKLTKFYVATAAEDGYQKGSYYSDSEQIYDKAAVTMGTTNMTNYSSTGNMLGSYYLKDGMLEFTVPNNNDKMSDANNYSIATVNASAYLNKEDSIGKDCIFGEFSDSKQTYPTVVVRFVGSSDEAAPTTDYGTADNNPLFMVKKIFEGVDDDDEVIYTIVGYQNGSEVRYTTKANTTLAKRVGKFNDRDYNATAVWDAVDGMTSEGASMYPGAETIADIIGVGDILGVDNNGTVFMMMVDASEFAEQVKDGNVDAIYSESDPGKSSSRDNLYMGMVSGSDLDEMAVMTVGTYKLTFDPARSMDTLVIEPSGEFVLSTENISTISDVVDFDEPERAGDYAFVRYANKGSLQEIFLFRFEN